MKIALFGDSFGYQHINPLYNSWVNLLSNDYDIDNFCQCGVSEYKILQQIKQANLNNYDKIIITHTSPNRIFVRDNPVHKHDPIYKNCDLIYSDLADRADAFSKAAQEYFKYIFDLEYAIDIHNMICQQIETVCNSYNTLHITHFDYTNLHKFPGLINFYPLWVKNRGIVNHYNEAGNKEVYDTVKKLL